MARFSFAIAAGLALAAPHAQAFSLVECLGSHSKAECSRQMMVEQENSKPLTPGQEIAGTSGKYTVRVLGDDWLLKNYGDHPEQAKDLGLTMGSSLGMLTIEQSQVQQADFEKTITDDMQGIYAGLQRGFRQGKIDITKSSQMELLPLTITGGAGTLGRFCYHIEIKGGKNACVYEGLIGSGNGESYKLLGSIADYDNMRADLENIITSFKFTQ